MFEHILPGIEQGKEFRVVHPAPHFRKVFDIVGGPTPTDLIAITMTWTWIPVDPAATRPTRYGWELGPFEILDGIGVDAVLKACEVTDPPRIIQDLPESRRFRDNGISPAGTDLQILRCAKKRHSVVKSNAGASLVDLGDGVLAIEFHSKMNAIGGDAVAMMTAGVAEASNNFDAVVVGNEAPAFSPELT